MAMLSTDARQRLRMLGQLDLGDWIETATGKQLWSIQRKIATAISQPYAKVAVPSCVSSGKFVRASEPVLAEGGWRSIDSLAVGDHIYAQDGTLTEVTGVYPQGKQQLYRFHLGNGITVDSGGPHLWAVDAWETTSGSTRYARRRHVVTTDEIIQRYGGLDQTPHSMKRLTLPMVEPVQFPTVDVPLDPYALGLLLGDGGLTTSTPVFSTADPELLGAFDSVRHRSKYDYSILGISSAIGELGLSGKRAWEKAVPEQYLWNDPDTRLAVLQGLMDTDGGISGVGTEFSTTSHKLAEQVQFLVQSLGGRASIRERTPTYTYKGERKQGRLSYRMNITLGVCPFRLRRKVEQWTTINDKRSRSMAYTIMRVEKVDVDDAVCISVAHPSKLFVLDNFIVTHNTHLAARIALAFFDAYTPGTPCVYCGPGDGTPGPCKGAKIITTSSKWEHLKNNLWGELRTAFPLIAQRVGLEGRLLPGDLRVESAPNHFIIGQVSNNAEGFQGYHAAHVLIIGDEATSVSEEVSQGIFGVLASGDARLLLIFNPTTPDTYAARQSMSSAVETIRITAWDTPEFTGEPKPPGAEFINDKFLEDMRAAGMGEGTYEWTTRVLAEFWELSDSALVSAEWVRNAKTNPYITGIRSIGVDLAPYGTSENVIAFRNGNVLEKIQTFPAMRPDLFWEGPVANAVKDFAPNYLIYDADGVGAGAIGEAMRVQRLMPPGGQVLPFRGALKTQGGYSNARAAWYWALRRRFENGNIVLACEDHEFEKQIININYSITPSGQIRVERKEEMKKRGMASPDRADGCLVAGTLVRTMRGEVPIESVTTSDKVLTRSGWRKVLRSWMTSPEAETVTVRLDSGATLSGTSDHPVWDGQTWRTLASFQIGDILPSWQTSLCSMESGTGETPTPHGNISLGTTGLRADTLTNALCTVSSTSMSTGHTTVRCRSFTTLTEIHSTTTPATFAPLREKSTQPSTAQAVRQNGWRRFALWRPPGIAAMRDGSGILTTGSGSPSSAKPSSSSVRHVALQPSRSTQNDPVGAAPPVISVVVGVDSSSPAAVYNLEVEDEHEYLANGILAHNCMYAFALSEELPMPTVAESSTVESVLGLHDVPDRATWNRDDPAYSSRKAKINPVLGVPDDW